MLLVIITSQLLVAFIHQPPYASYLSPFVPLLVILAGWYLSSASQFTRLLVGLVLIINFSLFPHAYFMKTSLATIKSTPHSLLQQVSNYLKQPTQPGDEVLSFYIPPVIQAQRQLPINFNGGNGSLSLLPTRQSQNYHLTNLDMLTAYLNSSQAAAVMFTDKDLIRLTPSQRQLFLTSLKDHYYLDQTWPQISQIEDPKTHFLYFYLPR